MALYIKRYIIVMEIYFSKKGEQNGYSDKKTEKN